MIITKPNDGLRDDAESSAATSGVDCVRAARSHLVEREERRLHGERGHEPEEDPVVRARRALLQRERPLRDAEGDDRGQHQSDHRVD